MCLAIYKPAGMFVKEEYLRNGFANHSDGAGIAWSEGGKLHIKKGIFNADEVVELYNQVKDFHCLIHFRKATHGKVDEANCHPFLFNDGKLALIHNGVLPIECTIEGMSDTAHYVKLVIEPLIKRYNIPINDGCLNYLISTSIGTGKMAIMTETGDTYVINPEKGEWDTGVWYSNTSYKWSYKSNTTYPPYTPPNSSSSYPPTQTYKSRNWKKRFESDDDSEDDASYLEFWKKALEESKEDAEAALKSKTQKIKLLGNGNDTSSSSTLTVEEVENLSDEEIANLSGENLNKEIKKHNETGPGYMMEYGYWDEKIESDIEEYMKQLHMSREEAVIKSFNNK